MNPILSKTSGLSENMPQRAELLRKSLSQDYQVGVDKMFFFYKLNFFRFPNQHFNHTHFQGLVIAHLAKTLALLGNLAQAEVEMKKWGQWAKVQRGRELTRWKEASVKLELFKGAILNNKQRKAAAKLGVNMTEVEEFIKNERRKSSTYIYLFDEEDEILIKQ